MAYSTSNIVGHDTYFSVSLMPPYEEGEEPGLSITPPFYNPNVVMIVEGNDQQLIDLRDIIQEYCQEHELIEGQKERVASFLEEMAALVRASGSGSAAR